MQKNEEKNTKLAVAAFARQRRAYPDRRRGGERHNHIIVLPAPPRGDFLPSKVQSVQKYHPEIKLSIIVRFFYLSNRTLTHDRAGRQGGHNLHIVLFK